MSKTKPKPSTARLRHDRTVWGVRITPDQKYLCSIGGKTLCVWDATTGQLRHQKSVTAGTDSVKGIALAPDGKRVASGVKKVTVLDVTTGKPVLQLEGHPRGEIWDVAYSPSGKWIATASGVNVHGADNSVALWDASTGENLARWPLKIGKQGIPCHTVAFSPDEKTLIAICEATCANPMIFSFDLATREEKARLELGEDEDLKRGMTFVGDRILVSISDKLRLLDAKTLKPCGELAIDTKSFAVAPDGKTLAAVSNDRETLTLHSFPSGDVIKTLQGLPWQWPEIRSVSFSVDGTRLAGGVNESVVVWDLRSGDVVLKPDVSPTA
jgi:WD40 repeat protein